jgi:hypothetical protein
MPGTKAISCRGDLNSTSLRIALMASHNGVAMTVSQQRDMSITSYLPFITS